VQARRMAEQGGDLVAALGKKPTIEALCGENIESIKWISLIMLTLLNVRPGFHAGAAAIASLQLEFLTANIKRDEPTHQDATCSVADLLDSIVATGSVATLYDAAMHVKILGLLRTKAIGLVVGPRLVALGKQIKLYKEKGG